ncbi:hypothetical protein [Epilithonimonas mollis]|uniref:Uncharacterized protein n=1 Tax=Epilithonimonas mollis TaxID=216903 RepID=A0A1M6N0F5_9FLAO|nr:hypothetical protein [Epilithonimonas mollis]SHJ89103.1 hypothetical protein SAMN05444371_0092 [Epilithonimonas mollis]
MSENYKIKRLYNLILNKEFEDSDYWYCTGKTYVINILKDFDDNDMIELESQILSWQLDKIQILSECLIYGFTNESTFNNQSKILTFLLANLEDESEKLDILENASDVILKGAYKSIELLDLIIEWFENKGYDKTPYYNLHCLRIYEAKKIAIRNNLIKQKINELRKEILSLTKSMQAFDEIDGIQDASIKILMDFDDEDFEQLKIELLLWNDNELEILAKVFSRGDINGNLIDDNYFYGFLFVILPTQKSVLLLDDMFYFFENQKIDFCLLQQIKNKLNELIAKRYIERSTYEFWSKEISVKEKDCI